MQTYNIMLLMGLGGPEILLIALVVLLLFGGKKIPEMMRGLGKGVKSFKDGMKDIEEPTPPDSTSNTQSPTPNTQNPTPNTQ